MLTHLVLALSMLAPPSEGAAQAAFNARDYEKALELYLERAADPGVHRPDATYGAHDSLIALHGQTGDPAQLCRALELARELLAHGPFADADERGSWEEIEARDVDEIKRAGITCSASPPQQPPVDERRAEEPQTAPPGAAIEGPMAAPAARDTSSSQVPRGRKIAGAVVVGLGAGLAGGLIGALVVRRDVNDAMMALGERAMAEDRELTMAELADLEARDGRYVRLTHLAIATGIAAGVSVLTGLALMLAPRARRLERLRVHGGGIVYSF
jgi:hypothetical protein